MTVVLKKVLLYSNREKEIDEYERLVTQAALPIDLMVCCNAEQVAQKIGQAEIVFGVHLPSDVYAKARKLRWIQSMWAGVEGLMQAGHLPEDVIITKPWGVFGRFLSHYVFGNLLAQKIHYQKALQQQAASEWAPYRIELLHGKCMGIAGLGDVAAEIASVARSFGMTVWALNSDGRPHALADESFSTAQRAEFVAGCDVLVLTLPSTPATRGMFDAKLLAHMRSDAWIINVGRGALIEDQALIELLEKKRIGGAILDVFQEEPLPADHKYWRLPNCIVTPHIGGPSLPDDICACFVENFKRYQLGQELHGLVDRERGY